MPKLPGLVGQRFGRWTVLKAVDTEILESGHKRHRTKWLCECDCGTRRIVDCLLRRSSNSCGCLRRDIIVGKNKTHGQGAHGKVTPEYKAWCSMKQRCYYPNDISYKNYGARGIKVCNEWFNDFESFFAYIGPKPSPEYSIDRINVDGNYEPGNIRWATPKQQMANRRKRND